MPNIENWLESVGLEKYIPVFVEAEVDFETLVELDEDDFKELGLPLGPRRKILKALSQLPTEGAETDIPYEPNLSADAERRHLTVMFVDLANSTEMATRIDAEDMRDVITGYQNTVAGIIGRFAGFTAKFMGDGVLCYFGWPHAGEDDAERAVRAGLEIIKVVSKTQAPDGTALATRIGLATGIVIVGDMIGTGATQEAAVVGETPNLAARLQGLAGLNELVVPAETLPLLGQAFEMTTLGLKDLKGVSDPVEAFVVEREAANESRFAARQSGALTPIVGRERETELIMERWAEVQGGQGQMVVVTGEAGIGKSRITRAVIDEVADDDHLRITYQCSPYHSDSAFYPVIQQLGFAAGFEAQDTADARLDKMETLINGKKEDRALIAAMLGINGEDRYGALTLTPQQQRARLMQILVEVSLRYAEKRPVLLIWEDLHWVDPTSLELLDLLLDAITDHRILVLSTARPTFDYGFGGHPGVTRLALNRLGRSMVSAIAGKLTGGKALPDEIIEVIAKRTDGVPLFVEELTKTILESGAMKEENDRFVLDGPLSAVAIPATLHDSLMARLDRQQPIKEVAQNAACIGREFHHGLLAQVSKLSEGELSQALDGLITAELIYRRGVPPEATYTFKHALVRDAAYDSLLKERRRAIHTRVLIALETDADAAPELLATHAEAADQTQRAIDLWEEAAKVAVARPAFAEGANHFERAIELLAPRLKGADRDAMMRSLSLQVQLSVVHMSNSGWSAAATRKSFETALVLDDKLGKTPMRFSILYGLSVSRYTRGDHEEAVLKGQLFVDEAETADVTAPAVVANRSHSVALFLMGEQRRAIPYSDRAVALFDPDIHLGLANEYGQDLGVGTFGVTSWMHLFRGRTRIAEDFQRKCRHYGEVCDSIVSKCYASLVVEHYADWTNDKAMFAKGVKDMFELSSEHGIELFHKWAGMGQGLVLMDEGDQTGLDVFLKYEAETTATPTRLLLPCYRQSAAKRAFEHGLMEDARALAARAKSMMDETGEIFTLPDYCILMSQFALHDGDSPRAESFLRDAMNEANRQGASLYELRAANELATLMAETGRGAEARRILLPIHECIAEGDCPLERAVSTRLLDDFRD